jgi:hypothetical protein
MVVIEHGCGILGEALDPPLPWPQTTTKERLHKLVDELSEQEAEAALVIVERRREDPILQLAAAPADDEPADAGEDTGAAEALAAYRRGESVSAEELRGAWHLGAGLLSQTL